jgi:hypothetical protein
MMGTDPDRHFRAGGNPCQQKVPSLYVVSMGSRLRGNDAAANPQALGPAATAVSRVRQSTGSRMPLLAAKLACKADEIRNGKPLRALGRVDAGIA